MEPHGVSSAAGQLVVALAALVATSTWLGISDWRSRTVGHGAIRACCAAAITVNALIAAMAIANAPAGIVDAITISKLMTGAIPTAIIIALLSGAVIAFWKLGLMASGDAYAIPAFLSILLFAATPVAVAAYFITAIACTAVVFVARNVINNARYKNMLYGPLLHKLYLMLFCYYGSSADFRYAFAYKAQDDDDICVRVKIRRDYDEDPFYQGKEKTWLVPGLPVLSGFAPATAAVIAATVLLS